MSAFIFSAFLVFCFALGDFKPPNNKLSKPSLSVTENNIFRGHGFDFNEFIGNLVEFVRDSNLDTHNRTNFSDRKYVQGKSKGTSEIVFPLVLVSKIVGMLLLNLAVVKFFLLKGFFGAKIALIILGVIFTRKLRQFETLTLLKNHQFYMGNGPSQYPTNEPNLSGYGYEYSFVPGFETPEQKYLSLTGKGGSQNTPNISHK